MSEHIPSTGAGLWSRGARRATGVVLALVVACSAGLTGLINAPAARAATTWYDVASPFSSSSPVGAATYITRSSVTGRAYASVGNKVLLVSEASAPVVVGGNGTPAPLTVGTPYSATSVTLSEPTGVAVNSTGTVLFVADAGLRQIFRVDLTVTTNNLTVLAGNDGGSSASTSFTSGGAATAQRLETPGDLALSGNQLYVADDGLKVAYRIDIAALPSPTATTVAGQIDAPGTPPSVATTATGSHVAGLTALAVDAAGQHLYIVSSDRPSSLGPGPVHLVAVDLTQTPHPTMVTIAGGAPYDPHGVPTEGPGSGSNLGDVTDVEVLSNGDVAIVNRDHVMSYDPSANPRDLRVLTSLGSPQSASPRLELGAALTSSVAATAGGGFVAVRDGRYSTFSPAGGPRLPGASSLPAGVVGSTYSYAFPDSRRYPSGGVATYALANGSTLPANLSLSPSGIISGQPFTPHNGSVDVEATDDTGTSTATYTLQVQAAPVVSSGGGGGGGGSSSGGGAPPSPPAGPQAPLGLLRSEGPDRQQTAAAVSRQLFPTATTSAGAASAVLTSASSFADGISGARLAAELRGPMLLTQRSALDERVAAELRRALPPGAPVYLLGGGSTLSAAVESAVRGLGFTPVRIGGRDRYETATLVADEVLRLSGGQAAPVYLASGTDFPDALSVAALAAHRDGVVVLTSGRTMPAATSAWLSRNDPRGERSTAVGGPAAAAAPLAARRIVGSDRYVTSAAVAASFDPSVSAVGVASGADWPDALVGAGAMGTVGGPLLLTDPQRLSAPARGHLAGLQGLTGAWVFGGTSAVGSGVADSLRTLLPVA